MNNVSVFVKTLVCLTFIWCLAENILPEKSIKKYTSYIYGLLVISMALSFFTTIDFEKNYTGNFDTQPYENNTAYIKNLFEEKLSNLLSEKFEDKSIRVELTDACKIKNIYCENKETYDAIVRYLDENK